MGVERNIVFLYPISAKLKELKEEFEKDDSLVIYELDSVNEYGQLIGVMEHSITFSSDLKKTEQYLNECKQFVRGKTSRNFLIQDKSISPIEFNKLQKLGLNEVIKEGAHLKSLSHKVGMFFNPFDEQLRKEEEAKNKALPSLLKMETTKTQIGEKNSSNAVQRVEKMALLDEDFDDPNKKRKKSGLGADFFIGNEHSSNFELQNDNKGEPLLNSAFDKMQRKNVAQFNPVVDTPKVKKASFEPIVGELQNNSHKSLNIKPPGELNKRKSSNVDFAQAELNQNNKLTDLAQADEELKRKKVKFEEVQSDLKRKKLKFEEMIAELKRKKIIGVETEETKKKKKKFDEILSELERKKSELDLHDEELKKKRTAFDEVEIELNRKKQLFKEVEADPKKKNKLLEEIIGLNKKKVEHFEEQEEILKKKKGIFEEILLANPVKKLIELDLDSDSAKPNKFEEVELDLNKKKGVQLDEDELERKHSNFEEVEQEGPERNKFIEANNNDDKKKHGQFSDLEIERRKLASMDFLYDHKKKRKSFQEIIIDPKKRKTLRFEPFKNVKSKLTENLDNDIDKTREEQTIDYSKFKKKHKDSGFVEDSVKSEKQKKKELDAILKEEEFTFYENRTYGLEYLIIYNDFLLQSDVDSSSQYKFIHFALHKDFDGVLSIYLIDSRIEDLAESNSQQLIALYGGHSATKTTLIEGDFEQYLHDSYTELINCSIPTWKDETYQIEVNEFIYPYYEDGKLLGFAIGHFNKSIHSHDDAAKVELLVMSLKGVLLGEYLNKGGA